MTAFSLHKFLLDCFDPEPQENVVVMYDLPHGNLLDTANWQERRAMAEEWWQELKNIGKERGFTVQPLLTFAATGVGGSPLPEFGELGGEKIKLADLFAQTTLVVALTEFSATGPLAGFAEYLPRFRAASMPGVKRSMQETGFAADYKKIQARCRELKDLLQTARGLNVEFSTGHHAYFDLRYRVPSVDDGCIDTSVWGKKGDAVLNLPGGETFEAPYEGEKGEVSLTKGELPVLIAGELTVFCVDKNRITEVKGDNARAKKWREFLAVDKGRRNIAEVAFGVNDLADPAGPIIESEKAGFHWAFGSSDHLGGVIGAKDFENPNNECHEDIVYAGENIVQIKMATIVAKEGPAVIVMRDGKYVV